MFVINLRKRQDRWQHITSELERAKISSFTRIEAIDGAAQDISQCVRRGILSPFGASRIALRDEEKIWGMDLTEGGLGCALSHIRIWELVSALQLSCAMIAEDDTEFSPHFQSRFCRIVKEIPLNWELMYLSGLDVENKCTDLMVSDHIARVPQLYRTTNLYLINAKGAKELLDVCCPLHFQLDTQMTMHTEDTYSSLPKNSPATFLKSSKPIPVVSKPKMYAAVPCIAIQRTFFGTDVQSHMPPDPPGQESARRKQAGW